MQLQNDSRLPSTQPVEAIATRASLFDKGRFFLLPGYVYPSREGARNDEQRESVEWDLRRGCNLVRNYICRASAGEKRATRSSEILSRFRVPRPDGARQKRERERRERRERRKKGEKGTRCKRIANGMEKGIWRHAAGKIRKDRNRVPLHSGSPTSPCLREWNKIENGLSSGRIGGSIWYLGGLYSDASVFGELLKRRRGIRNGEVDRVFGDARNWINWMLMSCEVSDNDWINSRISVALAFQ